MQTRGQRKQRTGIVLSNKMDKSITVGVDRLVRHPLYRKTLRRTTKLHAHDAENTCNVGDVVRIEETRPLSKLKHWKLVEIVKRAD